MYKPPQNSNRVKSIKTKFENIDYKNEQKQFKSKPVNIGLRSNLNPSLLTDTERAGKIPYCNIENLPGSSKQKEVLVRQLSDPSKRNIKRSPAFRVDKNLDNAAKKTETNTLFENKVKQFNSTKGCDKFDRVSGKCSENNTHSTNSGLHADLVSNSIALRKSGCDLNQNRRNLSLIVDKIDTNINLPLLREVPKTESDKLKKSVVQRPSLIKSKSSHDFQYIRSKFDSNVTSPVKSVTHELKSLDIKENISENNNTIIENNVDEPLILKNIDLSALYTEPIPKCLRQQHSDPIIKSNESVNLPSLNSIYSKSTLQLTEQNKRDFLLSLKDVLQSDLPPGLTDSLKVALSKPLPGGPAPQKPPRTFKHPTEVLFDLKKNLSFLHVVKEPKLSQECDRTQFKKGDIAKYKLHKLDTALRNNKLRVKRQRNVEVSTTSGEDSDDSLLYRSKCRSLPKAPETKACETVDADIDTYKPDSLLGDFNCFSSFTCHNPGYEKIKEPNSSFFVSMDKDPIYAEPVQLRGPETKTHRNSLYYMSTPLIKDSDQPDTVIQEEPSFLHSQKAQNVMDDQAYHTESSAKQKTRTILDDLGGSSDSSTKKVCSDNSSLSSFTSDSTPSPTMHDQHAKIHYLINNFEEVKRKTLPARLRKENNSTTSVLSTGCNVEKLKNSLEMASVSPKSQNGNSFRHMDRSLQNRNREKVADIIAKFQTYQRSMPKYQKPTVNKNTLFYCCLVIEKVQDCAQIKFQFPPNVEVPKDIEHLCFPESPDTPPLEGCSAAQTYSLLITSDTGERTYGYCRRVLPEGSPQCLPLAYCILSKYRAPRFYNKILTELESRHGIQNKFRDILISQFYHKMFPQPGQSIVINLSCIESNDHDTRNIEDSLDLTSFIRVNKTGEYGSINNKQKTHTDIFLSKHDVEKAVQSPSFLSIQGPRTELVVTLNSDTRYEDADLKVLHNLPPDILLKIFSSLLLERKVIFISSVISELSSCVDSLQSILYPFTWYHTFIPILPESLWDIVESPTPVVCGALSTAAVEDRRIENGIVVNLDTKSVLLEEGDEMKILSESMKKIWRRFITLAENTKTDEYVSSVYLADSYISVFITFMKNYKEFIVEGQFLKEQFIASGKTKGIRRFLKMFTETCMFYAFIDTSLNNPASLTQFDKKIEFYGSDNSQAILEKLIEWNRN